MSSASLSTTPLQPPPPGQFSNFKNPRNYLGLNLGITIPLMTIALTFSFFNLYDNRHSIHATHVFLAIAILLVFGYSILIFVLSPRLRHSWDIPISIVASPEYLKEQWAGDLLLGPCFFFAKGFILALYLSIFQIRKTSKLFIYFGFVLDGLCYWPQIIFAPIWCAPSPGQAWITVTTSRCNHQTYWGIVQSTLGLALDLYLFILPIPIIWNLNMSTQKKRAITAVFGTAIFGIAASIISLIYRLKLLQGTDVIWYSGAVLICNIVELWIAIIVGNMPSVLPRIRHLLTELEPITTVRIRLVSFVRSVASLTGSSSRSAHSGRQSQEHSNDQSGRHDVRHGSSQADNRRKKDALSTALAFGNMQNPQVTSSVVSYPGRVYDPDLPDNGLLKTVQIEQVEEKASTESEEQQLPK